MAEPQDALVPNPHVLAAQSEDALAVVPMAESENPDAVAAKKARTDEDQSEDVLAVVPIDEPKDPDEVAARTVRTDEKVTWEYRSSKDEYWKEMGNFHSKLYELEYLKNQYYFTYNHQYGANKEKNYFYKVDLNNFLQKNDTTGKVRRIRRCVERVERVPDDVPVAMEE